MPQRGWVRVLLILLLLIGGKPPRVASASPNDPPGPDRYTTRSVAYTSYTWWILRWEDNKKICEVTTEKEGIPSLGEIYRDCGEAVYEAWSAQPPCPPEILEEDSASCPGYYIHLVETHPALKEVPVALPPPMVWLTLDGCISDGTTNHCAAPPILHLIGDEPLPGERILRIEGKFGKSSFSCEGERCDISLSETKEEGKTLRFWAYSSYGDSSVVFSAKIRVLQDEEENWIVDVLSDEWRGDPVAACAQTWEAFPPAEGMPPWLAPAKSVRDLETTFSYAYLAGTLISRGIVDASFCPDNGLLENGSATPCGVEAAYPDIVSWQNRFDALIFSAARETGISARLLKSLFARESQFWPGLSEEGMDAGFGQMTEEGADTALQWNPIFFESFCPSVLESEACDKGYLHLDEDAQLQLREALVAQVNASCDSCPLGVDLAQADSSIAIFAHALLANCEQTGQIFRNLTGDAPGESVSYEDLWAFSLLNYNAGAGCLSLALQETLDAGDPLDWEHVSKNLTPVCRHAKSYVEDVRGSFSR